MLMVTPIAPTVSVERVTDVLQNCVLIIRAAVMLIMVRIATMLRIMESEQ